MGVRATDVPFETWQANDGHQDARHAGNASSKDCAASTDCSTTLSRPKIRMTTRLSVPGHRASLDRPAQKHARFRSTTIRHSAR
jgi:hypothetical protein